MGLCGQINQETIIRQHMSALAIKVRVPLFDGQNNSKHFMFMGWVVMGGASQFFAAIGDWLQPVTLILVQNPTNAII